MVNWRQIFCASLLFVGAGLSIVSLYGVITNPYDRPDGAVSASATIKKIDIAWKRRQQGELEHWEFLQRATWAYAEGIRYIWPKDQARIALWDNWVLWSMAYLDEVVAGLGLTNVDSLFSVYESIDYRRALARGYGICSQNALGLASLLEWRYGVDADVIGLDGHVVVEAHGFLLDPSVGLAMPFSLAEAERREARNGEISEIYAEAFESDQVARVYGQRGDLENVTPFAELGQFYDSSGNDRIDGVEGYRSKVYWVERASAWLKWILPMLMVLLGSLGLCRSKRPIGVARP
jgi:hypothetical protein